MTVCYFLVKVIFAWMMYIVLQLLADCLYLVAGYDLIVKDLVTISLEVTCHHVTSFAYLKAYPFVVFWFPVSTEDIDGL